MREFESLSQVTENKGLIGFQIPIKGLCSVNFLVATLYLPYCFMCILEHVKQWVTVNLSPCCY